MSKQKTKDEKIAVLKSIRQALKANPRVGIKQVCSDHKISTGTYYNWCRQEGKGSLEPCSRKPNRYGNVIDDDLRKLVITIWSNNQKKSITAIHKQVKSLGHRISYGTVNNIINSERIRLMNEAEHLHTIESEMAEYSFQKF